MQPKLGLGESWGEVLRRGMTWDPTWHNEYESVFSIARKIACASATSHEQVLSLIYFSGDELAVTRQFTDTEGEELHYVSSLLQVEPRRLTDISLAKILRRDDRRVVASGLRYCASCMRRSFHSPLFQLYFLDSCPLHGDRLSVACPHCDARPSVSQSRMTSFTVCPFCGFPYFPEAEDWLSEFSNTIDPESFRKAYNLLAARLAPGYVESAWHHWDMHRSDILTNRRPALAAIGALLRRDATAMQPGKSVSVQTADVEEVLAKTPFERNVRGKIHTTLSNHARLVCSEPQLIPYRVHRTAEERALELLYHFFGLECGRVGAAARRYIATDTVIGTLTTSDGRVITSNAFVEASVNRVVEGLYGEALSAVLSSRDGTAGRQWFEVGWQARFPFVWIGANREKGMLMIRATSDPLGIT